MEPWRPPRPRGCLGLLVSALAGATVAAGLTAAAYRRAGRW